MRRQRTGEKTHLKGTPDGGTVAVLLVQVGELGLKPLTVEHGVLRRRCKVSRARE